MTTIITGAIFLGAFRVVEFRNEVCTQLSKSGTAVKASASSRLGPHPGDVNPLQNLVSLPETAPTQVYLLGERNSGTKFVESLLVRGLNKKHTRYMPANKSGSLGSFSFATWTLSTDIPIFGIKHMFRHSPLNQTELKYLTQATDILWIMVVRNPCSWADAMYRFPWHMCPPKDPSRCPGPIIGLNLTATKGMPRKDFFQTEWGDWQESEYNPGDFTYRNVFAMRRHKLSIMAQLMDVAPHRFKILHLGQVEARPGTIVPDVAKQFHLQTNNKTGAIKGIHHGPVCLEEAEWKVAQAEIDWQMESRFGFVPSDCHMCYR